jgi:hypothetical protein
MSVRAGTTFRIDRSGTGVLRVDEGPGLDTYVFRSGSPLSISIDTWPYGEDQDRDVPTWGPAAGRVSDGVARSLDAKLNSATGAFERDNHVAACNQLAAFVRELEVQRDRHVDIASDDRLRPSIHRLRAQRCPAT